MSDQISDSVPFVSENCLSGQEMSVRPKKLWSQELSVGPRIVCWLLRITCRAKKIVYGVKNFLDAVKHFMKAGTIVKPGTKDLPKVLVGGIETLALDFCIMN